jgi:hypothetical protein
MGMVPLVCFIFNVDISFVVASRVQFHSSINLVLKNVSSRKNDNPHCATKPIKSHIIQQASEGKSGGLFVLDNSQTPDVKHI